MRLTSFLYILLPIFQLKNFLRFTGTIADLYEDSAHPTSAFSVYESLLNGSYPS